MNRAIYIPRPVWLQKGHKKAISGITNALVLPHDKATVEANCEGFKDDCRIIREYIEARFEQ